MWRTTWPLKYVWKQNEGSHVQASTWAHEWNNMTLATRTLKSPTSLIKPQVNISIKTFKQASKHNQRFNKDMEIKLQNP